MPYANAAAEFPILFAKIYIKKWYFIHHFYFTIFDIFYIHNIRKLTWLYLFIDILFLSYVFWFLWIYIFIFWTIVWNVKIDKIHYYRITVLFNRFFNSCRTFINSRVRLQTIFIAYVLPSHMPTHLTIMEVKGTKFHIVQISLNKK